MLDDTQTALSVRYLVSLDDQDLGSFTSCEGLGIEVVMETREEGGNNDFVWQLPSRLKFPNVKLSRPLGPDSDKVVRWFSALSAGYQRCTGTIEAKTGSGATVAEWSLYDVVPVRWTGPVLTPDQPKVVMETLEIAHHGFLQTNSRY